jgi:VanZ family protein
MKTLYRDTGLLFFYCLVIFYLSSQSRLPIPPAFPHQDKAIHTAAYFVMGLLAWRFFRHLTHSGLLKSIATMLFCSFYGISDEWHQSFVPGRDADTMDWAADTFGGFLAAHVYYYVERIRHFKRIC